LSTSSGYSPLDYCTQLMLSEQVCILKSRPDKISTTWWFRDMYVDLSGCQSIPSTSRICVDNTGFVGGFGVSLLGAILLFLGATGAFASTSAYSSRPSSHCDKTALTTSIIRSGNYPVSRWNWLPHVRAGTPHYLADG
jgi:hypothetical protein